MTLRSMILAMASCLVTWAAQAQPIQGVYVGGGAGWLLPMPIKTTDYAPAIGSGFNIKQNSGSSTELSVGYALGNGWRFELEGTYGHASVSGFSNTVFPAAGSGTINNVGVMANALFDLDVGSPYIYPYLGVGVGYQSTRLDSFSLTSTSKTVTYSAGGHSGGFAAQGIGGLSFPVPNMPGLSVTVDYRFMDILGGENFNGTTSFAGPPGGAPASGTTKFHNQFDQSVMIGLRYAFNTPRPAATGTSEAAVEPLPAGQPQTYLVSFNSDHTALSNRAQAVVRQAAVTASRQRTRIELTGNAPASGTVPPSRALSEQRARTVAAELINNGVPKDSIVILARGAPGAAGGMQADNRQVEIVVD